MNNDRINQLKVEIDQLKEYVEGELCRKCEEMTKQLEEYKKMLYEYSRTDNQT